MPQLLKIKIELTMKMHKQFFSALLMGALFFLSTTLSAQPHRGHRAGPFQALEQWKTELNLTEAQQAQLEALKPAFEKSLADLKDKEFDSPEAHKEAFHGLMQEYKTSIGQILTEEQKAMLEAKRAERREGRQDRMKKVDKKGLHQEMKAYRDQNIHPVMLQQRAKLEQKISAEDKALIAKLRNQFEANRQEMEQLKQNPGHSREDFQALREGHKEERAALKGLVEKYDKEIDALLTEVKGQQGQWHKDMQAIHEKYAPGREEGPSKKGEGRRGKGEKQMRHPGHHPHPGMHPDGDGKEMRKGHFLLLDPNAPAEAPTKAAVTTNVNVYPNPAANRMTLDYTLLKAGNVRIELRDKEGNLVKVVEESQKTAGDYSLPVDATTLQDGVYYLTIVSQGQRTAQKVVVAKQ